MLAAPGPLPDGPGFSWEMKWDGARALVGAAGERVRVTSRTGRDVTRSYPELAALPGLVRGRQVLLDGELVALDSDGRPRFGLLQERLHVQTPTAALLARVPVYYYVFDLLYLDAVSLMDRTFQDRRGQLDELDVRHERIRISPVWRSDPGNPDPVGPRVLEAARQHRLEGVVVKRLDSRYRPGRRDPAWIKHPFRQATEVVVCGWTPGEGRRRDRIGSLLLGAHDEHDQLVYLGHVGTGFSDAELARMQRLLEELEQPDSPFPAGQVPRDRARHAHWVAPMLVGEVEYREFVTRLRHPSWRGLHSDVPTELVRVPPQS
ncbi:DNA ligase [Prauserella endophytica]|uniref:DNA ligase (ATP) n=2 Tax=Prauserella endophytica TaxID=1592324 RepID=A0ABY2RUY8_9PSEU|nr:DNA ligase [Prauserella endophytica]